VATRFPAFLWLRLRTPGTASLQCELHHLGWEGHRLDVRVVLAIYFSLEGHRLDVRVVLATYFPLEGHRLDVRVVLATYFSLEGQRLDVRVVAIHV
jgi:hypothetical protein